MALKWTDHLDNHTLWSARSVDGSEYRARFVRITERGLVEWQFTYTQEGERRTILFGTFSACRGAASWRERNRRKART